MEFVLLGIYFVILLAIGFTACIVHLHFKIFSRWKEYRSLMSAFAYGTTYFSAVIFIGYAGRIGWIWSSAIWIAIGNAVLGSYLAWRILARQTRYLTHRLDVSTMPEFLKYDMIVKL